MNGGLVRLANL